MVRDALQALTMRVALLAAAAGCGVVVAHAADQPISEAETLLFMSNHLAQVAPQHRLHYTFRKEGTLEAGFSDSVDIDVTGADGASGKRISAHFLNKRDGARAPDLPHVEGNPALLLFLEREIHEMARLTGGRPDYFQRRIRAALADHAETRDASVTVGGKTLAAKQITIAPFAEDPNRARFEKFAGKTYVFLLSNDVPGVLYRVEARVPAGDAPAHPPLLVETMTFSSEQPLR